MQDSDNGTSPVTLQIFFEQIVGVWYLFGVIADYVGN